MSVPSGAVLEQDRAAGRKRRKQKTRGGHRDTKLAYLFLAPVVILLGIFVIWPAAYAVYLSFQNWSFYKAPEFVGWRNYRNVLVDPLFRAAIVRGFQFVLMTVPVIMVTAFLFASLVVTVSKKFASVLKVTIYIPTIISAVITSIVFGIIYEYSGGILNWALGRMGIDRIAWLGDPDWALLAIAVPAIWLGLGLSSLIMVAAMIDIPQEFYEAASIEGAGWWAKTIYITLPQMKNVILFLLVTGFVAAIQQYEIPLVMTNGGPLQSTTLPNLFIFNHFRGDPTVGFSIAAALLLFVVLGSVSAVIFRILNSEKLVD